MKKSCSREICKMCLCINPIGFNVSNSIWKAVVPPEYQSKTVCIGCFVKKADEKCIPWDEEIELFPVSEYSHLNKREILNAVAGMKKSMISKPYPNYHAARIKSPDSFLRIRVMQTTKEGIMIYGGPLKSDPTGPTKTQAVRFPKDKFTAAQAKAWLKEHDYTPISFEPASEKSEKRDWDAKSILESQKKKKSFWPSISKRTNE